MYYQDRIMGELGQEVSILSMIYLDSTLHLQLVNLDASRATRPSLLREASVFLERFLFHVEELFVRETVWQPHNFYELILSPKQRLNLHYDGITFSWIIKPN